MSVSVFYCIVLYCIVLRQYRILEFGNVKVNVIFVDACDVQQNSRFTKCVILNKVYNSL